MSSEKQRQYLKDYYVANKERLGVYKKTRYRSNLANEMLQRAAKRAKEKGLPFDLTIDDIEIPSHCPILGFLLEVGNYKSQPHLDRIKPIKGYIKGNVRVISGLANRIKTDATPEEIRKVADYLQGDSL